ncbi:DNA damage responsive protein [Homalodisca vitripennis]|nr:DNA damage responsive protein [Homalodisca vitripennis]
MFNIASGNFTPETDPVPDIQVQSDVHLEKEVRPNINKPVFTAKPEENSLMAVTVGALLAVIILLAVAIFLIVSRHRQRKGFASPLAAKAALPGSDSSCGTADRSHQGIDTALLVDSGYQEPYQALRYAPYYSYSAVVVDSVKGLPTDASHDYAVPEVGTLPLGKSSPTPTVIPHPPVVPAENLYAIGLVRNIKDDCKTNKKPSPPAPVPAPAPDVLTALRRRLQNSSVPQFPRHRLRMLSKLGDGAFGTVYIAEADGISEYGSTTTLGNRLVAVKFLLHNATEKEKLDFQRDVRILSALEDHNLARVLGLCSQEEPLCVIMEYLDHGDLCQFLQNHGLAEPPTTGLPGIKTLSYNCLLYMAGQIASGMRYLESLNFVHRDLATRNCLVGKGYLIKISDFGTDNELYTNDYYRLDGGMALPVRWMAWESIYMGKYTTKSDVWSFGVTLWEILHLAQKRPYDTLTDSEVVENLEQLYQDTGAFSFLPRPPTPPTTKDVTDLLSECWRRTAAERPSFREIHLFLQRKTLGYAPLS